jgi:LETM1 and EF-hand domain-containing protein 1, mitochondrial
MSLNRSATRVAPVLLRGGRRIALPSSRRLPSAIPAIAILLPRRGLATETTPGSGLGGNQPPPGFNLEQAKKPLLQEQKKEAAKEKESTAEKKTEAQTIADQGAMTRDGPSAHAPTAATEIQSLAELAAEKAAADKKVAKKKEEDKKLTIWQKVKKEVVHYWDGTKLLATEIRISSKLALKMAAGYELSRRENRQLQRTVQDLGRLVPFSVFVIVPFAELLLPVALKLFPNLLPSTYEGAKSKETKATSLRATRKEVSNFLRQTLKETGLPVTAANTQREEFIQFFKKVRTTGESPTQADVIKVCKIFKDDLTLDNLSRPQLVGICRYMNLNTIGPDTFLRYQIRHRMRQIKRDDKAISFEGVDSLSVPELQNACASRGLRTFGVSPARLRDDLQLWLDLRLKYGVPSTLLVLGNAFMYAQGKESELNTQIDALQAVLSSIPEELFHEIELEVHTAEGAATNKQRLEVLKEQQELIEEENEQTAEHSSGRSPPKDLDNIDEKEEKKQASN